MGFLSSPTPTFSVHIHVLVSCILDLHFFCVTCYFSRVCESINLVFEVRSKSFQFLGAWCRLRQEPRPTAKKKKNTHKNPLAAVDAKRKFVLLCLGKNLQFLRYQREDLKRKAGSNKALSRLVFGSLQKKGSDPVRALKVVEVGKTGLFVAISTLYAWTSQLCLPPLCVAIRISTNINSFE